MSAMHGQTGKPFRGPYVDIVLIFHNDSTRSYVGESPNMYVGRPKHPSKLSDSSDVAIIVAMCISKQMEHV